MSHVKGINWEITHELYEDEIKRQQSILDSTTNSAERAAAQWMIDELNRMNHIAVEEAEKQS